jgi:iron complex outermembrane receptor protein
VLFVAFMVAFAGPPGQAIASPPATSASPEVACTSTWEARVVDHDADEGIPGAIVVVDAPGEEAPRFTRTDDTGRVRVEGLCRGTLHAIVKESAHAPLDVEVELGDGVTSSTFEMDALHGHHSHRVIIVHDQAPTTMSSGQSLSGAALARTRGQSLADVAAGIAGVSVLRSAAGGIGKPVIRGHFGRRNLVVVDGVRHEGQEWGIDHTPEVDPQGASRITIIKGASTTRYGSEAIGGAVLLESRPIPRAPGVDGEVSTHGFSNPLGGGLAARVDVAPAAAKGFGFRVEGNYARHRALVAPEYALDNTGSLSWNVGTRLGYQSDDFDVELGYRLMRAGLGICSCLRVSSVEDFELAIGRGRPIDADAYRADFQIERAYQSIWHHTATARSRIELGAAGELHATYAYQWDDRREYDVVREGVTGPQLSFGLGTHALDLDYEHAAAKLGRAWSLVGTLGAAIHQQRNTFESNRSLIPSYVQAGWSVFDVERFVHERVELEIGARYEGLHRVATLNERDWLGQSAGGRLDEAACRESGEGGQCTHVFHAPSVTLGALTRPARNVPELTWRLQASSSARIPAIDEQFMNGAAPSFPILGFGDSRIGTERAWGGETTLQFDGDWLFVEGAVHGSFIDDYIYFVPQPQEGQCAPLTCTARGPFPVFSFLPTDAAFAGGELRLDLLAPRAPFGLWASGAWVRGFDVRSGEQLAFTPADRYTLAGRYFWPDSRVSARGYVEINGVLVAKRRGIDPDTDFAPAPPAYVLLGAAVGVEFPQEHLLHRLSLLGHNLTNARYRDYNDLLRYFADQPGWALQLRYSVDFDAPTSGRSKRRHLRTRSSRHAEGSRAGRRLIG